MRPEYALRLAQNSRIGPAAFMISSINGATSTATNASGNPSRSNRALTLEPFSSLIWCQELPDIAPPAHVALHEPPMTVV